MEEKKLEDFTDENQVELKRIMWFMRNNAIIKIGRHGEDMKLSLQYVDDVIYAVEMKEV